MTTNSLIQKLEAAKDEWSHGSYDEGLDTAIDIIRKHHAEQVMGEVSAECAVSPHKDSNLASPASPSEIRYNADRDDPLIEAVTRGARMWTVGNQRQCIPKDIAYDIVKELRPLMTTSKLAQGEAPSLPDWVLPSAKALLEMDAKGCLVPHGIGNNARDIIAEFIKAHESPKREASEDWPDLRTETQEVLTWAHNVMMCCDNLPEDNKAKYPVDVFYLRVLCEKVKAYEKGQSDRLLNFFRKKTNQIEGA